MIGIILTGSSRGLGKAFFDELNNKDLYLYCISRRFLSYQKDLEKKNNKIKLIKCDLSKVEDLDNTIKIFESISLENINELFFINNAGIVEPIDKVGKLDDEMIYRSIYVNFLAPVLFTNKIMKFNDLKITILNISSGAANKPFEGWAMYCSTKAGYKMFSEVLLAENLKNNQINIHNIDPGVMDTDMQCKIRESNSEKFPLHDVFVKFKTEDKLVPAKKVAKEIIREYINI